MLSVSCACYNVFQVIPSLVAHEARSNKPHVSKPAYPSLLPASGYSMVQLVRKRRGQGGNRHREGRLRREEALATNQRADSEVNDFKSVNIIVICTEVDAAKVNAPTRVGKEAPREVGSSQVD